MSKHIGRTCLWSVALKVEDTALTWMLTSAVKQKVPVNAKRYRKKILSPGCLIYLSTSTYQLYFCIHLLIWLQPVITTFRVSNKSW